MEDTLRGLDKLSHSEADAWVLILVLMEDTLRVPCVLLDNHNGEHCLNPCFNGRYSQRRTMFVFHLVLISLNPCFNGRYSQRQLWILLIWKIKVLILVLMEDTLRVWIIFVNQLRFRLNPCFNGRYSQRFHYSALLLNSEIVLILVLMEDTLRAS